MSVETTKAELPGWVPPPLPRHGDHVREGTVSFSAVPSAAGAGDLAAKTKTAWGQVFAAVASDRWLVAVEQPADAGGSGQYVVDVGLGAAGVEEVIGTLSALRSTSGVGYHPPYLSPIPLWIPAGARLALRFCGLGVSYSGFSRTWTTHFVLAP